METEKIFSINVGALNVYVQSVAKVMPRIGSIQFKIEICYNCYTMLHGAGLTRHA